MTNQIPPQLLQSLVGGLVEAMEKIGDVPADADAAKQDAAYLQTFANVLDAHGAEIPDDIRMRIVDMAYFLKRFMAASRAFDRAHAEGDKAASKDCLATLQLMCKEIEGKSDFLRFPFAAEALCKAKSFDEFCTLLPSVQLDTLYGSAYGRVSQFPLIWAMSAKDKPLERVQLMLAAGARTDLATRLGDTVLHAMAEMKRTAKIRLPILRLLVFKGADLEAETIHGETPLTAAIALGSAEDVENFLTVGSKVRRRDMKLATKNPRKLRIVLDHLAGDNARLREAASLGGWLRGEIKMTENAAEEALKKGAKGEFHAKIIDDLNQSLAMLAELPGYLSHDATQKVTWKEEPGAFWAVRGAKTLDEYREALSRVDIATFYMPGTHPIYWPMEAREYRPERLWLMLSAGASVAGGNNGTALHIFAGERRRNAAEQFRMAQMLVQAGGDLEALDYKGETPLAIAVGLNGHAEAAALLKLGARPKMSLSSRRLFGDKVDHPLIFAAADNVRIFKCMLEAGADVTARDEDGNTLRDYLNQEVARLSKLVATDVSGNLQRRIERSVRNYRKSLKLLVTFET